jgi:hypothetical protein
MFEKGQSGNPAGRPAGSLNKTTSKAKKVFEELFFENIDQLREDLQSLTPDKRVQALLKVAEFIVPKPSPAMEISLEYKELERLLLSTPKEYISIIEEKLLNLHINNKHQTQIDNE